MDFSEQELFVADQLEDDAAAYAQDQRRMLEQAEHLVSQLKLCGFITKHEAELLQFFVK